MSILRDRIASQGAPQGIDETGHPAGSPATPMVMPMSEISYQGEQALYGTMHPLITADGAVVPVASPARRQQPYAEVYPAGRP